MDKPRVGSYAPFLEARQKREKRQQKASGRPAFDLIGVLDGAEDRELPVSELMSRSGMGFAEYSDALKRLQVAGIIEMTGAAGEEVVRLTPKGEEIAGLSRS